ncbi:MAG: hypothetical protein JNM39_01470 [Bdellovibrionaceae bacterium]|jgi:competence protein ComGC|nr:hypothetical protein [Pseudobdellovibrionaceae bacterium]
MLTQVKHLRKNDGMAVIEMIPIVLVIVLLINFSIGFFGIVHTANMNGISARNYMFETIRHRSNLDYHRASNIQYTEVGGRYGGVVSELVGEKESWGATARRLSWVSMFGGRSSRSGAELNREPAADSQKSVHNNSITGLGEAGTRNENVEVYNVWIRSLYGICHTSKCGD